MTRTGAALALAAGLLAAAPASPRDLAADGALALRTTLKSTLVVSRFPEEVPLYPVEVGSDALFRLRLDLVAKPSEQLGAGASWETRLRATAPPEAASGGFLPPEAPPAFRIRSLDAPLAMAEGFRWRHELDRAFAEPETGRTKEQTAKLKSWLPAGMAFDAVPASKPAKARKVRKAA